MEWLTLITKCIHNNITDAQIFVFGSRVNGSNRKYSDIDIAIKSNTKIDLMILSTIISDLEESNIPYKVDVVDFNTVPSNILSGGVFI